MCLLSSCPINYEPLYGDIFNGSMLFAISCVIGFLPRLSCCCCSSHINSVHQVREITGRTPVTLQSKNVAGKNQSTELQLYAHILCAFRAFLCFHLTRARRSRAAIMVARFGQVFSSTFYGSGAVRVRVRVKPVRTRDILKLLPTQPDPSRPGIYFVNSFWPGLTPPARFREPPGMICGSGNII